MKIPILDLKKQYASIKKEVNSAIKEVVTNQDFILGEEVKNLEKEVALYCNAKYAVGVASGTDALILSLKALGIKQGDEVITSPFTFVATAEAISLIGAKPVFVDIEPKTYNIDPALIEKKVTRFTKAIIPVHIYGQCADMDPIINIAKKCNLRVIEDAAQAIGATYKGRKTGSLGDCAALSFFPSKNLGGFGDGGMVTTDKEDMADAIKTLRVHGSKIRYIHSFIGMNSRLDNLQAAVLRVKLKYLEKWLNARRESAKYYDERLKDMPVVVPYTPSYNTHTYHLYVLRVRSGLDKLTQFLIDGGIEARTYYPIPLHLQECYKDLGYREGDLPESEKAAKETLSIPIFPEMELEEKDFIVNRIRSFFKK